MLELNKKTSMENIMMINGIFNRFRIASNWSFMACKMLCICFIISTVAFAQGSSIGRLVPLDPNWTPLSHEEKMLLIEQSTPTINNGNIMSNSARQGGDTFADAIAITLPYNGSGSTMGYANDYGPFDDNSNMVCDWGSSSYWGLASDVVYKLTLTETTNIFVDLENSTYDTALGVYDSTDTALVVANDDYNNLQSFLHCDLPPGTYYIVVDGYSTSEGDYEIMVNEYVQPEEVAFIELSEEEAEPGDNVSVAVNVDAAGYMVTSGLSLVLNAAEFEFAGFQNHHVDFTGISLDASFDGWSMDYNNTDSVLYVAMAGANGVHMTDFGTMFTLDFQVNEDAPGGDVPVDVVHGLLNANVPEWQVEQGGIWVFGDPTPPDLPPTEFDLLSPDDGSTVFIDQSNLNESTTFSWEASTDPEGNDISYAAVFYPNINLPDGSQFFVGASMNFLESTSTTIPHQDVVAALSAQGATTGWVNWNVVASDGEFFPALTFFGGHVEVPNSDNLNFGTGNFAISLWFEHYGDWDSLQVSQQLLVKHNVNSDRYEIQLNRMDNGAVELTAYVGDDVMSANREVHTDHIYHLVLSRSNGLVTMYMDGENVGEMTSAGNTTSDESLYLGMDPYYGETFYGNMTDVTMYSSGLSPESVTTLFEDGFQSPINISEETSLVAHWPMEGDNQDPESNLILEDESGNQNNGALSGYVWFWAVQTGNYIWSTSMRYLGFDISNALSVDDISVPMEFALHQNYPNPFNPTTSIKFDLPNAGNVKLVIYDMMGREVRTLLNNNINAGFQSVKWDATNDFGKPVSAGVYIYQIQADDFIQSKKMILLK